MEKITLHKVQYNKMYLDEWTAALSGLAVNNLKTQGFDATRLTLGSLTGNAYGVYQTYPSPYP